MHTEVLIAKRESGKMSSLSLSRTRELKAPSNKLIKRCAFTLAEVLITLGIIGIIANMTIPSLYNNTQKEVVVTKLKKAFNVLSQATELSEIDNGPVAGWTVSATTNADATLVWFNTFLGPYLRTTRVDKSTDNHSIYAYLADGTIIQFWQAETNRTHVYFYFKPIDKAVAGKDMFIFYLGATPASMNSYCNHTTDYLRPYDYPVGATSNRNDFIGDETYGCQKGSTYMAHCAALIMYDGWKISSDYPFYQ